MNILADFHHSDLWWSHHLIFEKGLGHKLFRPRGIEWHDEGYYFPNNTDVAMQFLVHSMYDYDFATKYFDKARPRLEKEMDDTLYAGMDTINGCPFYPLFRTLTLSEFKDSDIDVIICSTSDHQETFLKLKDTYKPAAKLVREAGNPGELSALHPAYENLLTSDVESFMYGKATNKLLYHQRFDENVFKYSPPTGQKKIGCFMPTFMLEGEAVKFLEEHLAKTGFEFAAYGVNCERYLNTKSSLVEEMNKCAFVWQVKPRGDGFGHVVHNAFALGRPPIIVPMHYAGRLAALLMNDMETCVFISETDIDKNAEKLNKAFDNVLKMSAKARKTFEDSVDYETEQDEIKGFLESLA